MNLAKLKDSELLFNIKSLAHQERHVLSQILNHLREVERRKLFSELKYKSLFDYCIKELKYSEGQAGRRIQAMRLIKEIPELENKVQAGVLTLSHLSQAQSYFREKAKHTPVSQTEKSQILNQLENKTSRETERILVSLGPELALPAEKERSVGESHTEIKFLIDGDLKESLTEIRVLLGARALHMNYAQLIKEMADLSVTVLRAKKFGKKRTEHVGVLPAPKNPTSAKSKSFTPAPELSDGRAAKTILKSIKHQIWQRDQGKCTRCHGRSLLNIDHIHPRALGGDNTIENLRLLCFHCNQRRAMKTYGIWDSRPV